MRVILSLYNYLTVVLHAVTAVLVEFYSKLSAKYIPPRKFLYPICQTDF